MKGLFSLLNKKKKCKNDTLIVDSLKDAIRNNPLGMQLILLKEPSVWSKCGINGDVHLDKYYELKYNGDKALKDAMLELIEKLQTPVSSEELRLEKSFQPITRKKLAELDDDQLINIGTDEEPVQVTLAYKWYYYENGVYVDVAKGYSTTRFWGKDHGCISWREMYGYVRSLPPGKHGGSIDMVIR